MGLTKAQLTEIQQRYAIRSTATGEVSFPLTTIERDELCRLALANLETQEWLVERSGYMPHNHAEVDIIKRLRGQR